MLDKEHAKKTNTPSSSTVSKSAQASQDAPPKRKPRKLNKEPTSTSTAPAPSTTPIEAAAELEALKSRVRGLEAKVEELYKSTPSPANTSTRSPRRRGKGRKNSSSAATATLGNLAKDRQEQSTPLPNEEGQEEEEEADEELSRLEGELEVARQDLAHYRPSPRRTTTSDSVEEIPRDGPATTTDANRQVTLSGSYRIPLPATLNPEDVKTIQSGVSAAQNVARSFLDQRRANQALRNAQAETPPPPSSSSSSQPASASAKGSSKSKARAPAAQASTELTTQLDNGAGGKQSWGEWIGGYSLAISRAVKTIEHEAAMEAQQQQQQTRPASSSKAGAAGTKKKRLGVKSKLSGEQVQGLMG
jgi:hypothetical protein